MKPLQIKSHCFIIFIWLFPYKLWLRYATSRSEGACCNCLIVMLFPQSFIYFKCNCIVVDIMFWCSQPPVSTFFLSCLLMFDFVLSSPLHVGSSFEYDSGRFEEVITTLDIDDYIYEEIIRVRSSSFFLTATFFFLFNLIWSKLLFNSNRRGAWLQFWWISSTSLQDPPCLCRESVGGILSCPWDLIQTHQPRW